MSVPPNPLPDPSENLPEPSPVMSEDAHVPLEPVPSEPVLTAPAKQSFPAWSAWDVLAVLVFTAVAVFGFSLAALFIARAVPGYRHAPIAELATNARIVIGAQAAAYPLVLIFMFVLVRSRTRERFGRAIHWNWPGISARDSSFWESSWPWRSMGCRVFCLYRSRCPWTSISTMRPAPT